MTDEATPTVQEERLSQVPDVQASWDDLLFGVRRSVRYHTRRRRFFENIGRWKTALSLLAGSAAMAAILGQNCRSPVALVASAFVTLISTMDLVLGSSVKARSHADLARHFLELERKMTRVKVPTTENVLQCTEQRLQIEAEEPPVLRVLDVLCHNELMRAMGYEQQYLCYVPWYKRLLAPCISMSAEGLQTVGEREVQMEKIRSTQKSS